ncbi:hypothetical protein QTO34_019956 [Cnephaeus nilssonii]|uniref:Uncharacterized protein n=1 Tax=Cnephaeus nilssonii TaxID=3371016 RepID=A0AA40HYD9_CNENI|nr:hypothetical protein QTO34_019956 [Eptesicus nilssonii]
MLWEEETSSPGQQGSASLSGGQGLLEASTSDEHCAQASTNHSDIPISSTTRCWLTCCCTLATRSDGPAGVAVGSAGSHTRDRAISGASAEEVLRSPQGLTSRTRSMREPGSISSLTGVTVTRNGLGVCPGPG